MLGTLDTIYIRFRHVSQISHIRETNFSHVSHALYKMVIATLVAWRQIFSHSGVPRQRNTRVAKMRLKQLR